MAEIEDSLFEDVNIPDDNEIGFGSGNNNITTAAGPSNDEAVVKPPLEVVAAAGSKGKQQQADTDTLSEQDREGLAADFQTRRDTVRSKINHLRRSQDSLSGHASRATTLTTDSLRAAQRILNLTVDPIDLPQWRMILTSWQETVAKLGPQLHPVDATNLFDQVKAMAFVYFASSLQDVCRHFVKIGCSLDLELRYFSQALDTVSYQDRIEAFQGVPDQMVIDEMDKIARLETRLGALIGALRTDLPNLEAAASSARLGFSQNIEAVTNTFHQWIIYDSEAQMAQVLAEVEKTQDPDDVNMLNHDDNYMRQWTLVLSMVSFKLMHASITDLKDLEREVTTTKDVVDSLA